MKTITMADLFAGGGGTSTGAEQAAAENGCRIDLTAINHWERAVETHAANHPAARHLCASLDALNPRDLYGEGELDILWASPECTHHSVARGGRPMSDQSRATAWCVVRWAEALRPSVIWVENVHEFLSWGPIGSNGRPLESRRGELFRAWVAALEACGYRVDWRILCAADYGDPTTRARLFVQAVRGRRKIRWPEPTHSEAVDADLFGSRKHWRGACEAIDWSLPSRSIFNRKRPLAENTLRRIRAGLEKFGVNPFMVELRGTSEGHCHRTARSIQDPLRTVTAGGGHFAFVIPTAHSGGHDRCHPITAPLPTVSGNRGDFALIIEYYGTGGAVPVSEPLPAVTTRDRFGLLRANGGDILFRMLQPHELAAAQGFPAGYRFCGTKKEQVKQIGNAVPPGLARALVGAMMENSP